MSGSGRVYAILSVLWMAVVIVTPGVGYPWRTASLERQKMRHTRYGGQQEQLRATGSSLFRRTWWIWLLGLLPLLVSVGGSVRATMLRVRHAAGHGMNASVVLMPLPLFLHPMRLGREWRWWAENLALGEARGTYRRDRCLHVSPGVARLGRCYAHIHASARPEACGRSMRRDRYREIG